MILFFQMSSTVQYETVGSEEVAVDGALKALIPFSGSLSPESVRDRMSCPTLNGPSGAVWRRTTIRHVTSARAFCLYACERTGEAM